MIIRKNHGGGHSYWDENGLKVPGVTTFTKEGLPKPALENWKIETTVDHAIDHWDELSALPISERRKRLMKARYGAGDKAKVRGTKVHKVAELLIQDHDVAIPEGLEGYTEACVRFLDEFDAIPIYVEFTCYSDTNRHGGTGDLIADLLDPDDPEPDPDRRNRVRWLLDYKTSNSGVFGETALQLAPYRFAEYLIDDRGDEPVPVEMDKVGIDRCGVVLLRQDGTYKLVPVQVDEDQYRQFLYIQQTALWMENSRGLVGDPIEPPHTSTYRLTAVGPAADDSNPWDL